MGLTPPVLWLAFGGLPGTPATGSGTFGSPLLLRLAGVAPRARRWRVSVVQRHGRVGTSVWTGVWTGMRRWVRRCMHRSVHRVGWLCRVRAAARSAWVSTASTSWAVSCCRSFHLFFFIEWNHVWVSASPAATPASSTGSSASRPLRVGVCSLFRALFAIGLLRIGRLWILFVRFTATCSRSA